MSLPMVSVHILVALAQGDGLVSVSPMILKSSAPAKAIDVSVFALAARTQTARDWVGKVEEVAAEYRRTTRDFRWAAHGKWWNDFWDRSWISAEGKPGDDTFIVSRGYALQNWVTACAGRGNLPISFNGSVFTVKTIFVLLVMPPVARHRSDCRSQESTR